MKKNFLLFIFIFFKMKYCHTIYGRYEGKN